MKKILSICAALVSAITMSAAQVTLNFSTADGLAAMNVTPATIEEGATQGQGVDFVSATVDGVAITADKGSNKTAPRVWTNLNKSTELRCYNGNTLVIKGALESDKITQIAFTGGDLKFSELTNGQWTSKEGANSVTFTATATCKVSTIIITMNEEAVEYKPDTISVSKAIDLIKNDAALAAKAHYVKGVVAGDPFELGKNGPAFYMTDIKNDKDSLEGFKIGKDANTAYKDVEEMSQDIAMGDTILIYANSLAQYGKIFETTGGYFCETLGKFKAIELDWAEDGEATRFADHWELSIAKVSGNEQNVIKLAFASDKVDAIAGNHYLAQGSSITIDGVETAITSGSVKLTFKEQGGTGLNTYVTKVKAVAGDDIYVLSAEIEFYAQDEEFEEIDLVGDRPFVPTEGQLITCAQARSYALSLADGEEGTITFSVEGYVTDLFTDGTQFWMDDAQGNKTQTILIYKFKSLTPAGIALKNDAKVKVSGKAKNYGGKPEVVNAAVEVIEGGGEVTVVEVTVAGAVAACKALAVNAVSTETYAITGYITKIEYEYSAEYGNISFWMSDDLNDNGQVFQAYRAKCDASVAAKLLPGAKVKVTDKLKHFHQDATEGDNPKPERTVYETLGGGSVELLAGAGVEDITVNVKAAKFIYDGQLYILRDNAIYNVQGQRVK